MCWICREAEADSGEHKYPAALLRRIPDDWSDLVHGGSDGQVFHSQGPNSKHFKQWVLCTICNNRRTQKQDRALDAFLRYVIENEDEVWKSRQVTMAFDPESHNPLDLYRAFLKLAFSRFHDDGVRIASAVADYVAGGDDWRAANNHVRIKLRAVENFKEMALTYPWETDAPWFDSPFFITNQISFGWFGIHYVYAPEERPDLPWPKWSFDIASVESCVLIQGLQVDPLL